MDQAPSRAATVATVLAVVVVATGAAALLAWGPDPERVQPSASTTTARSATTTPSAAPSASATPTASAEPSVGTEQERSATVIKKIKAARASIPDRVILRQLRNTAERIAQQEPMASAAPAPADIEPDSNRALGYQLMLDFGFAADQWPALDALWTRESGWNHLAENPSSGAYGIPQSLPANKMAVVGKDYRTNPQTQIQWGLAYIAARYGVPDRAWAHSERVGWY
ncbi:transglycosylase SLT domain-containing protein [Nocardioides panacisoli]|uniref:aggregation-promoting factor C-terminal-like domain-containing protein n=1 Tax=Nocardioides panacisoli TaxID=627624 RepID=UPI001C634A72|nr:transglycosylase SLT domain-containing protein [Nocardioides panacisoli]QYJ03423.1 transglycosylase SLT domain-containing protein [Nocardioides panacisoli]